jgi:hypothetical protein
MYSDVGPRHCGLEPISVAWSGRGVDAGKTQFSNRNLRVFADAEKQIGWA